MTLAPTLCNPDLHLGWSLEFLAPHTSFGPLALLYIFCLSWCSWDIQRYISQTPLEGRMCCTTSGTGLSWPQLLSPSSLLQLWDSGQTLLSCQAWPPTPVTIPLSPLFAQHPSLGCQRLVSLALWCDNFSCPILLSPFVYTSVAYQYSKNLSPSHDPQLVPG